MITLALDASTYAGSAAVIADDRLLAEADAPMRGRDAEALLPAVASSLEHANVPPRALSRIVCGAGPGSFTSLRIAASIAKGLALAVRCPMFAVSSLALLATADGRPRAGRYLAVLDALRGDAYVAAYAVSTSGEVTIILPERLVMQSEVGALATELDADTVGSGQKIDRAPHARGVLALESLLARSGPVDVASWEPAYGRKAEAQSRWEAAHGRQLPTSGSAGTP
jgi:tRNA threonylcarbamoyladenosine biosynthesis protein TsaB